MHFALLLAINFALIYVGSSALSDRGTLPAATVRHLHHHALSAGSGQVAAMSSRGAYRLSRDDCQ